MNIYRTCDSGPRLGAASRTRDLLHLFADAHRFDRQPAHGAPRPPLPAVAGIVNGGAGGT